LKSHVEAVEAESPAFQSRHVEADPAPANQSKCVEVTAPANKSKQAMLKRPVEEAPAPANESNHDVLKRHVEMFYQED
jgi:hypothetical protein